MLVNNNIGNELKHHREALKMSVEEVSDTLKIKARDIVFLEQNSIHLITKHLYLAGFIKSYCRLLKINDSIAEEYLKNIKNICNTKNKKHQLINLDSSSEQNPNREYLVNALIIFAIIYLLLISFSQFELRNLEITKLITHQFSKIENFNQ